MAPNTTVAHLAQLGASVLASVAQLSEAANELDEPLSQSPSSLAAILAATDTSSKNSEQPRPEQGGIHISYSYLRSLTPRECLWEFRFYADEIRELTRVLQVPDPFWVADGSRFEAIEAVALLLARFRSSADQFELVRKYDRSQTAISFVVNEMVLWLDECWSFLFGFEGNDLLSQDNLAEYARAATDAGCPMDTIWGWIDCTIRANCRPARFQRQDYNGHKKHHAKKYQAVKLANGMIGHLYGPEPGRHNDNYLLSQSHILRDCRKYALRPGTTNTTPISQRYFQLFGDPAYGLSPVMISPFSGQGERTKREKEWNNAMSQIRIEVEHGFSGVLSEWPFLHVWWKHRTFSSPIGCYYHVAALLTNAINCVRPNQTARRMDLPPPTLEEYFQGP